jgi:hypothetical protein
MTSRRIRSATSSDSLVVISGTMPGRSTGSGLCRDDRRGPEDSAIQRLLIT